MPGDSLFVFSNTVLVGGLEYCFHILGIVIPIDFHIFQRGRLNHQPVYDSTCVCVKIQTRSGCYALNLFLELLRVFFMLRYEILLGTSKAQMKQND